MTNSCIQSATKSGPDDNNRLCEPPRSIKPHPCKKVCDNSSLSLITICRSSRMCSALWQQSFKSYQFNFASSRRHIFSSYVRTKRVLAGEAGCLMLRPPQQTITTQDFRTCRCSLARLHHSLPRSLASVSCCLLRPEHRQRKRKASADDHDQVPSLI